MYQSRLDKEIEGLSVEDIPQVLCYVITYYYLLIGTERKTQYNEQY